MIISMGEEKLYNLSTVREFVGDDQEQITGLVMIFLEDVPDMLEKLNESSKTSNLEDLKFYSHKLKSSIDLFQVSDLHDLIRSLEENAKNRTSEELIPEQVETVTYVLDSVMAQLKADFGL